MDELASKLQSILSTPQGQEQLKKIQAMLGLSPGEPPPGGSPLGGMNLSGLASMLGGLAGGGNAGGAAPGGSSLGGMDLSGLASMLGGLAGGGNAGGAAPGGGSLGGMDLSGLASMLGGPGGGTADAGGLPSIDMGTILKLQKAFQSMNTNDKNSQLLLALKPHLGERRSHRVDQAIRMMRLFSMLPALRESGIFEGL